PGLVIDGVDCGCAVAFLLADASALVALFLGRALIVVALGHHGPPPWLFFRTQAEGPATATDQPGGPSSHWAATVTVTKSPGLSMVPGSGETSTTGPGLTSGTSAGWTSATRSGWQAVDWRSADTPSISNVSSAVNPDLGAHEVTSTLSTPAGRGAAHANTGPRSMTTVSLIGVPHVWAFVAHSCGTATAAPARPTSRMPAGARSDSGEATGVPGEPPAGHSAATEPTTAAVAAAAPATAKAPSANERMPFRRLSRA